MGWWLLFSMKLRFCLNSVDNKEINVVAVDKEHQHDGTEFKLLSYIAIARMCLRDVYTRQSRQQDSCQRASSSLLENLQRAQPKLNNKIVKGAATCKNTSKFCLNSVDNKEINVVAVDKEHQRDGTEFKLLFSCGVI